ncbi:MAG: nickel pincer cofactor biosynthesis protein LarB [Candidatus Omnitrophica bacterium]|nr:nickel pincer cofactor biosynthesis protein LarB [Candidatus Omnitrophota bacterium]
MSPKSGYCDLGFAKLDTDRKKRRGYPEAVYCPGKDLDYLERIAGQFIKHRQDLLLTKLDKEVYACLKGKFPLLGYDPRARLGFILKDKAKTKKGMVLVVSAGTSDIPVAEEASLTLEAMGSRVKRLYDVGVAGVHRLMQNLPLLRKAKVIIVVAGMEGALASLVSGLVKAPVISVPTSCGYGANFEGLAALLTMLNGCSPGVGVVNIDNGFGAGYLAAIINNSRQ